MPNGKKFDLEERTARFAENILALAKLIPKTIITIIKKSKAHGFKS